MTRYRIAFHVQVDVDGEDDLDAVHRANIACGWPPHTSPPIGPYTKTVFYRDDEVSAEVLYARPLMVKELP